MARPRTPTKILELRGAGKKNPARLRARENEPEPAQGIGSPPAHLSDIQRRIWDEIVDIVPPGVLGSSDRIAVERCAVLVDKARNDRSNWTGADERNLAQYLSRMGMTPADRPRIAIPKEKPRDPWEDM